MSVLRDTLARVRDRHRRLERRRRVATAAAWWLAAVWLAVAFDAGWSLSAWAEDDPFANYELPVAARIGIAGALLIGFVVVLTRLRTARATRQRNDPYYARLCERRGALPAGTLVNAAELGGQATADPLRDALARRAVGRGDGLAASIDAARVIDSHPTKRAVRWLVGVGLFWLISAAALSAVPGPHAYAVGLARLALPTADVPAYAPTRLAAAIAPTPTAIGDDVSVRAQVKGAAPRDLRLRYADGTTAALSGTRRETTLRDVRQPVTVTVEGAHTRSRSITIRPVELPAITAITVEARHADGRTAQVRPPTRQPARVLVGARLVVTVSTSGPRAALDDARAEGLTLSLTMPDGRVEVPLRLVTADGLRSRDAPTLRFEGLTDSELAAVNASQSADATAPDDLPGAGLVAPADALSGATAGGDEAEAIAAQLEAGLPAEGMTIASGSSSSQDPGTGTGQNPDATGGTGGQGTTEPFDASAYYDQVSRQLVERGGLTAQQAADHRRAIDRAPAMYRRITADYFLRLALDSAEANR